jgi:hypothetical protein
MNLSRNCLRRLIVNFVHFMAKHYRHQDTKAQKGLLTNGIFSCLSAFVANFPARPGQGINTINNKMIQT